MNNVFTYRNYLDRPEELLKVIQEKFGSSREHARKQIFGTLTFLAVNGRPSISKNKVTEVLMALGFKAPEIKTAIEDYLVRKQLAAIPIGELNHIPASPVEL